MTSHYFLRIILLFAIVLTSCSTDETVQTNSYTNETTEAGNYYPSTLDSFWNYDVSNTDNSSNETLMTTDNIYVDNVTATFFTLGANNNTIANGTMNGLLTSSELSRTDTELILNGNLELPEELSDLIDFEINLNAIKLYKINATNGAELSNSSNTIQQDFNGFPLTINYEITTNALGNEDTISLNGDTYNTVTIADFKLKLTVTTTITVAGFSVDINILEPQDVISITNYFAKDIGLVRSQANTNFTISSTAITALEAAGIDLDGIPTSASITNIQELTDYNIME